MLLVAPGCNDDERQLSEAELVSQADEICRQGAESFAEIQSEPPGNASEALDQTEELVGVATDELNELRRLRPPQELRDPYDAYLEARRAALELLEAGRDAAAERDAEAYRQAKLEAIAGQRERLGLARAAGLKDCSNPRA
jgi:hypothetical protein